MKKRKWQGPIQTWIWGIGASLAIAFAGDYLDAYMQQIVVMCAINIILAISLNLISGFTGQFSLGHAGFMAVGAYFSAYLSMQWSPFPESLAILNFPLYAIAAGTVAAGFGFLLGLPTLRLKGDYLAIVTLGFGEIIRVLLLNMEVVGGARGMYGIPGPASFFLNFTHDLIWMFVMIICAYRLIQSRHGRSFLSVREDEVAAESLGISTTRVKVRAFVISSFFAGIAGSLFAHYSGNLNPAIFQFVKSIDVVIMVVLGGMGSILGSVLGAIFVTVLPEALRPLQHLIGIDLRMVIYSLLLVLMMILKPQGLMGFNFSRERK